MKQSKPKMHPDRERGFTLVEVMIAAFAMILIFFALAQMYTMSRSQLLSEQSKRIATHVAQARLESLRRDYRYEDLPAIAGNDTTYVVSGMTYNVAHLVSVDIPETLSTTVAVTVDWTFMDRGRAVDRSVSSMSILGRSAE